MTEDAEKTAAEKLADAVRRKAEPEKGKGGGAPGRDSGGRGASAAATSNLEPTVSKRSGSFKGR